VIVLWTRSALRDLGGIDREQARRIRDAVERLAATGQGDAKSLRGATADARLRVGDYRVLFDADETALTVLRVRHRREAYR
jgi:mRNA interferase RelE/StbE